MFKNSKIICAALVQLHKNVIDLRYGCHLFRINFKSISSLGNPHDKKMNRRELIQKTLAGFGALSLPISLTACGDDADSNTQPNTQVQVFAWVASGDPYKLKLSFGHVTPSDSSARLEVQWEVAKMQTLNTLQQQERC
jgi:hypothetical protein